MQLSKKLSAITSRPYWYVYVAGVLVLIVTAYLWYALVYMNPKNVFWGMVNNSLSTQAVTTQVAQTSGSEQVNQLVRFDLLAREAQSVTVLKQGQTAVKTEMIGTMATDYSRYLSIQTDQKGANGKPLNTAGVINVWARSSTTSANTTPLLAQALLGLGLPVGSTPIPVGAVTPSERQALVAEMTSGGIYELSFGNNGVTKTHQHGHVYYTYTVKVQTVLYVHLMQDFAKDVGLHELDGINPNNYATAQPLAVRLTIDARSRQLVSVDTGQGYVQKYEAYGAPIHVTLPHTTISQTELNKRLSEL